MGSENEMLLRPLGDVVYFMPPFCITPEEIDRMVAVAVEGIEAALRWSTTSPTRLETRVGDDKITGGIIFIFCEPSRTLTALSVPGILDEEIHVDVDLAGFTFDCKPALSI
jgi:hypothetical protein